MQAAAILIYRGSPHTALRYHYETHIDKGYVDIREILEAGDAPGFIVSDRDVSYIRSLEDKLRDSKWINPQMRAFIDFMQAELDNTDDRKN